MIVQFACQLPTKQEWNECIHDTWDSCSYPDMTTNHRWRKKSKKISQYNHCAHVNQNFEMRKRIMKNQNQADLDADIAAAIVDGYGIGVGAEVAAVVGIDVMTQTAVIIGCTVH